MGNAIRNETGILNTINRTSAFGLWRFADEYRQAAKLVENSAKNDMDIAAPRYYLLGHSIELTLKSYLLAKGVPLLELRSMKNMGHDLEKALQRAEELNLTRLLTISTEERDAITLLNKTYQSKEHEYLVTGHVYWPLTSSLFNFLNKALPAIRTICLEATKLA